MANAAAQLAGLTLANRWTVVSQLPSQPSSGGWSSVPYITRDQEGSEYFLKAFDFSDAFTPAPGKDLLRVLQAMTAAYNHERDILEHCKGRRLSHVVTAVDHGYVQVPGYSAAEGTVYFLVFERAATDLRRQVDLAKRLDTICCLKIMNDVTLALWQVHREGIAHQDPKPSNVLVFEDETCRIADFGRSSRRGSPIWIDELDVAGDRTYAPPELLYGYRHPEFTARRLGCDLYLLGNLAGYLFTGVNITAAVFSRLDSQFHFQNWGGTYTDVLPYVIKAFEDAVIELRGYMDPLIQTEAAQIVRELCNPDLAKRGHPKGLGRLDQYSLERYRSRIDLLLKEKTILARTRKKST